MYFSVDTTHGGKVMDWQYEDINSAQEYRDLSKDSSGGNTQLQKRDHWIFQRYREVFLVTQIRTRQGTAINSDVGESWAAGTLSFRPGGEQPFITPPDLLDTNEDSVKWTCTSDKLSPIYGKDNIQKHAQIFESYSDWVNV